jgi:hypothetical protein
MSIIRITAHQYALAQSRIDYATARLEWMRREMAAQSR